MSARMGRVLFVGFVDLSGGVLPLSDHFLDSTSFLSISLIHYFILLVCRVADRIGCDGLWYPTLDVLSPNVASLCALHYDQCLVSCIWARIRGIRDWNGNWIWQCLISTYLRTKLVPGGKNPPGVYPETKKEKKNDTTMMEPKRS